MLSRSGSPAPAPREGESAQARIAKRERLSADESDRVVRIVRVVNLGENAFGDRERFWDWFRSPQRRFDGRSPLQMLRTDAGARLVENLLIGLEEGFVA